MTGSENTRPLAAGIRWALCLLVAALPWLLPAPAGLPPAAWRYAGLFLAVFAGLVLEPAPPALISLLGLAVAGLMRVGPPGSETVAIFTSPSPETLRWVFSGFASPLIWLMFAVSMIGLGFEKTGLAGRIGHMLIHCFGKSTLGLGYAVAVTEGLLALFVPSATARSAGIVRPLVMGIPSLCVSGSGKAPRAVGAYLVWVGFASSCVSSSLFLTAFIPNLIAVDMLRLAGLPAPEWRTWLYAAAPAGLLLLLLTPLLAYWLYPPDLKRLESIPHGGDGCIPRSRVQSARQLGLLALFALTIIAWVAGEPYGFASPLSALLLVCLMAMTGILGWNDILGHSRAWNMLVWMGSMLSLTAGLDNTGILDWFLGLVRDGMIGFTPNMFLLGLAILFFFTRYLTAGSSSYAAMLLPLFLAAGSAMAGVSPADAAHFGLLLCITLGLSGVLTPYATGQGPVWLASGYVKHGEFWFLGLLFGVIYLAVALCVMTPWICLSGLV